MEDLVFKTIVYLALTPLAFVTGFLLLTLMAVLAIRSLDWWKE
jgi:hypothetical protein